MYGETGGMATGMWLFWLMLIVFIVVLVKLFSGNGQSTLTDSSADSRDNPLEILKEQFARGEIEEKEYERRRRELENRDYSGNSLEAVENFRKVIAIFQPEVLEKVETELQKLNVPGVSVTRAKGYGEYANFYKSDWMLTHVRIEIFIGKDRADEIAGAIMRAAHTRMEGDGIVAIQPVESVFHTRTMEKCNYEVCD